MMCGSCGRMLTNDLEADNAAKWTLFEPRIPYCADSPECERDVEAGVGGAFTGCGVCGRRQGIEHQLGCPRCACEGTGWVEDETACGDSEHCSPINPCVCNPECEDIMDIKLLEKQ